jgi:uncharacterized protein (TIRG00374 family)
MQRRYVAAGIGLLATAALLWWTLHDVVWAEVWEQIRDMEPLPFVAALALAMANVVGRGLRWGYLFPSPPPPPAPLVKSTFVGALANNLLPVRAGEVASALALNRASRTNVGVALGTVGVGRVLDLLTIVGMLGVALAAAPSDADVPDAIAPAAVGLVAIGAAVLIVAALWTDRVASFVRSLLERLLPESIGHRAGDTAAGLLQGLAVLRRPRRMLQAVGWSLAIWGANATSIYLGMQAFGVDAPFSAALTVQGLIALGIAIPSSPGFFGPFEAAAKLALAIYGVAASAAVGFVLPFHVLVYFLPTTLIGLASLSSIGLRLRSLGREVADSDHVTH